MRWDKRLFDIIGALALTLLLSPIAIIISILILVTDGQPILYVSERMKTDTRPFNMIKFRTMTAIQKDAGVSGGDKDSRITKVGAFLRRFRLDELPQLLNVLIGDMSFVGPRPPLRQYVETYPKIYGKVLQSRPGITGLATIVFHKTEARLLTACTSSEQTDRVYRTRCIGRKSQLDLIYQKNRSLCFDLLIMWKTAFNL